jgi:uncharacterized protein YkwD
VLLAVVVAGALVVVVSGGIGGQILFSADTDVTLSNATQVVDGTDTGSPERTPQPSPERATGTPVETNSAQTDSAVGRTAGPTESPVTRAGGTRPDTGDDGTLDPAVVERAIHLEVNRVRAAHDRPELEYDASLGAAARTYSEDVARGDYFPHAGPAVGTFEDRYGGVGYDCRLDLGGDRVPTGGENVARYPAVGNETTVAEAVVDGWMSSTMHRENILRAFWRSEGIGVVIEDGAVYATQNLC